MELNTDYFCFRALPHLRRGSQPGDRDTDTQGGVHSIRRNIVSFYFSIFKYFILIKILTSYFLKHFSFVIFILQFWNRTFSARLKINFVLLSFFRVFVSVYSFSVCFFYSYHTRKRLKIYFCTNFLFFLFTTCIYILVYAKLYIFVWLQCLLKPFSWLLWSNKRYVCRFK